METLGDRPYLILDLTEEGSKKAVSDSSRKRPLKASEKMVRPKISPCFHLKLFIKVF